MAREITYAQAMAEALREEMRRDETVFLLGEDVATVLVTRALHEEFGSRRVRNTPISEAAIVGAALGAALTGCRPVAEMMRVDFMTVAMDQIINQVAKVRYMFGGTARVPLVIHATCGGGRSAAAQHSQSLEALFVHVPGLYVVMPTTPADAKGLLKAAIRDDNPVVFLTPGMVYASRGPVPDLAEDHLVPLGLADIKRPGTDVTVVATGSMVPRSLAAADILAEQDIEVEVIDPRTLKPLDLDAIAASVRKTKRLVVVNEAPRTGSVASEIAASVLETCFDDLDAPIRRVGGADVPMPFAAELEAAVIPTEEAIIAAVAEVVGVSLAI